MNALTNLIFLYFLHCWPVALDLERVSALAVVQMEGCVMTCPLVRPYRCALYSLSSSLHFPSFLLTSLTLSLSHSLTLSCSRCSCYLCVQDLSHSLSLGWFEILLGVSTIFVFRISLCVHDLSSASLLYILVVFSVLSVTFLVVVPSSGYTDPRREILTLVHWPDVFINPTSLRRLDKLTSNNNTVGN